MATTAHRYCWRNGTPSRRFQLYDVDVSLPLSPSFFVLPFCDSVGRIIGTGIFSTPSSILSSVGSVGASLMLWVLGFALSFCGLFVWLEYGTMFPRSGGEKVYLEAVYKKPKFLATIIFATNAILLGFTASGCIVRRSRLILFVLMAPERFDFDFATLRFRSLRKSSNSSRHITSSA